MTISSAAASANWPGNDFEIGDLVGLAGIVFIDVQIAGQLVLAAAEIEFHVDSIRKIVARLCRRDRAQLCRRCSARRDCFG
jgi:hypothetical protein